MVCIVAITTSCPTVLLIVWLRLLLKAAGVGNSSLKFDRLFQEQQEDVHLLEDNRKLLIKMCPGLSLSFLDSRAPFLLDLQGNLKDFYSFLNVSCPGLCAYISKT